MPNIPGESASRSLASHYQSVTKVSRALFAKQYRSLVLTYLTKTLKIVTEIIIIFNRTIKNILHNFIPHEIRCDDRDPPWIDSSIRHLIQDENEAYKFFKRSNKINQHFENFQSLQNLPLKRLSKDIILDYRQN